MEPKFLGSADRPSGPKERIAIHFINEVGVDRRQRMRRRSAPIGGAYSAAAAAPVIGVATERMKSEIRGTISDLNRDPLNTP